MLKFRCFYIPLSKVVLDEILVIIPVYLDRVSYFELLEAPVSMMSCLGSKLRRLGDRWFTALAFGLFSGRQSLKSVALMTHYCMSWFEDSVHMTIASSFGPSAF